MRFKAINLLMGALIICLVATTVFAERTMKFQAPSGKLSGRPSSFSFSGRQPGSSGFRPTAKQERLSPRIWGSTSSSPSRAGSFGGMRDGMMRTRADKPRIPQGSLNRNRVSSRVFNREDNRHRSGSLDFRFSHRQREPVSVAVSRSRRDNDHHYRNYNYRGRWHYGYNGYWYYPWSGLGVSYYWDGLGFYVNSGYPLSYTYVWVPGYWQTYYVTEEFLNSNGRICYRYVPYRIWVSGYWGIRYW